MTTTRRAFLFGAVSAALAAPAIVPLSSLMRLWVPKPALIPYIPPSPALLETVYYMQNRQFFAMTATGLVQLSRVEDYTNWNTA